MTPGPVVDQGDRPSVRLLAVGVLTGVLLAGLATGAAGRRAMADSRPVVQQPTRIVSLSVCVDEILLRVASRSQIASLTAQAANPGFSTISGKLAGIPLNNGRAEGVARLNPDLVISDSFNARTTVHLLKRMKIRVETMRYAATADQIRRNILQIAALTGQRERGRTMVARFDRRLARYRRPPGAKRYGILFYQARGFVPGAGTLADAAMTDAGFVNVARRFGIASVGQISLEQLVVAQPDVVVFLRSVRNAPSMARSSFRHPALQRLKTRVAMTTLPSNLLNCGSPAYAEAVQRLAAVRQKMTGRNGR